MLALDGEAMKICIARVDGGWKPGLAGVHTYSRLNDWEVIDGVFTADGEVVIILSTRQRWPTGWWDLSVDPCIDSLLMQGARSAE